jgi:hypothetical protein
MEGSREAVAAGERLCAEGASVRAEAALIARRRVIYVSGYDPQGAEGYYRLFARSWKRFLTLWPLASQLGPLKLESEDFAHWMIETAGPNWQVWTRYDFLERKHLGVYRLRVFARYRA